MMLDQQTFDKMIQKKASANTRQSFNYFWVSFVSQIIVYAFATHIVIKFMGNWQMVSAALMVIAVYIPFTIILMKKFKALAILKDASLRSYVQKQYDLLDSFYRFKKRYEVMIIPVACFVVIFLEFELHVPGSVWAYPEAAVIISIISIAACYISLRSSNKKSFDIPLSKLRMIINDLNAN